MVCPSSLQPYLCAGGARLSVYCTGGAVAAGAWGESGGQTGAEIDRVEIKIKVGIEGAGGRAVSYRHTHSVYNACILSTEALP